MATLLLLCSHTHTHTLAGARCKCTRSLFPATLRQKKFAIVRSRPAPQNARARARVCGPGGVHLLTSLRCWRAHTNHHHHTFRLRQTPTAPNTHARTRARTHTSRRSSDAQSAPNLSGSRRRRRHQHAQTLLHLCELTVVLVCVAPLLSGPASCVVVYSLLCARACLYVSPVSLASRLLVRSAPLTRARESLASRRHGRRRAPGIATHKRRPTDNIH